VAEEDLHRASALYQQAIEIDPLFAHAHARLSRVHISMYWFHYDHTPARLAMAKRAVDRALAITPDLPEARQALGYYYYYGKSDYRMALEQFSAVGGQRPNDASVLASQGYIQRRLGKWDDALKAIEGATELDPRSALIAYERANTLLLLRRYNDAIAYFDRCLWLTPAWSDVYVKKAMAHLLRDWSMDEAVNVIKEAAKHLNPTELGVEWILLDALVTYFGEDLQAILRDLWVDEGEMEIYFIVKARFSIRLGDLQEGRSAYDSARVLLETKVKAQPDDARLHIHLAIAYAGLGKKEQAHESGKRALELVPCEKDHILGIFVMELMSIVFVMLGEYDEAVKLLKSILVVPANFSIALLRNFSAFDEIRNYKPFRELVSEMPERSRGPAN
jgi:tetratricopeptide (TPR) repeat protein